MVTIDQSEDAPEGLVGKDFVEYMKNKKPTPTETVAEEGEEVEHIAKPRIKGKRIGEMRPVKGGKPAGEATGYGGHEGIDASKETFEGKHPHLAKAADIGKKVKGEVGKEIEGMNKRLQETYNEKEEERGEEKEEVKKKSTPKKKSKKYKDLDDFDFEDEDEEDKISSFKQKVLPGNYKSAYEGGGGGSGSYKSAFEGKVGSGVYRPAYKTTVRERPTESPSSEMTRQKIERQPQVDRFNIQNWQSMGFPNTLPQSARGNLFRHAQPRPQPTVVPMVRQPYQPRAPISTTRATVRAPLSGLIPKIGLNLNTMPQLMKPRAIITPPRAQAPTHTKVPTTTPLTFMGVNLNERKKAEPKPITKIGEGYKHVPLVVMNGFYPESGYNPKKDPITKKSIIPKIGATITPNNFTMFGYRMKNRKL